MVKTGLIISIVMHCALLAVGVVSYYMSPGLDVSPPKPIPVNIMSATEFTAVKAGRMDAEKGETTFDKGEDSKKPIDDKDSKIIKKVEATTKEQTKEPQPEVKKTEPEQKPKEEPKTKEDTKQQIAAVDQKPEPKKTEPKKPEPKKPEPKKAEKKEQDKPKPKQAKDLKKAKQDFDPDAIARQLQLDKNHTAGGTTRLARADGTQFEKESEGQRNGSDKQMSVDEVGAFKQQLYKCWKIQAGGEDAMNIVVVVNFRLKKDGSVDGFPQVLKSHEATQGVGSPFFENMAEAAKSAIIECAPYKLPVQKYADWDDNNVTFDPKEMRDMGH